MKVRTIRQRRNRTMNRLQAWVLVLRVSAYEPIFVHPQVVVDLRGVCPHNRQYYSWPGVCMDCGKVFA